MLPPVCCTSHQVELHHGTQHPRTGEEVTYVVEQQGEEEGEGEGREDTVFTEEDQRLVRDRLEGRRRAGGRRRGGKSWP